MLFELKAPTQATIESLTNRLENHGDDKVRAVSIGLKITAPNTLLDILAPGLLTALYTKPDEDNTPGPRTFEGMELSHLPLLRSPAIEMLAIKGSYEGWTLHVPYGIDDSTMLKFGGCKVDKFRVWPIEGGSCVVKLRIGTADIDESKFGKLSMLLGDTRGILLLAPEKAQGTIDGSNDAFERDHPGASKPQPDLLDADPPPDAKALAAEAVAKAKGKPDDAAGGDAGQVSTEGGQPGERGENWPIPEGDGSSAVSSDGGSGATGSDAAEFEAGMKAALEKAAVKPTRRSAKNKKAPE